VSRNAFQTFLIAINRWKLQ